MSQTPASKTATDAAQTETKVDKKAALKALGFVALTRVVLPMAVVVVTSVVVNKLINGSETESTEA